MVSFVVLSIWEDFKSLIARPAVGLERSCLYCFDFLILGFLCGRLLLLFSLSSSISYKIFPSWQAKKKTCPIWNYYCSECKTKTIWTLYSKQKEIRNHYYYYYYYLAHKEGLKCHMRARKVAYRESKVVNTRMQS